MEHFRREYRGRYKRESSTCHNIRCCPASPDKTYVLHALPLLSLTTNSQWWLWVHLVAFQSVTEIIDTTDPSKTLSYPQPAALSNLSQWINENHSQLRQTEIRSSSLWPTGFQKLNVLCLYRERQLFMLHWSLLTTDYGLWHPELLFNRQWTAVSEKGIQHSSRLFGCQRADDSGMYPAKKRPSQTIQQKVVARLNQ